MPARLFLGQTHLNFLQVFVSACDTLRMTLNMTRIFLSYLRMFKSTDTKTFIQEKGMDLKMLPELHKHVFKAENMFASIFETIRSVFQSENIS